MPVDDAPTKTNAEGLAAALSPGKLEGIVAEELTSAPIIDIHTHLFMPSLGKLGLWGIDELITYHYLEAELFRSSGITADEYFRLSKRQKADAIWKALFLENTPVSEAARGVIAVLQAFGLSTDREDLIEARAFFASQEPRAHIRRVFELAGITEAVMTNDPLDPEEAPLWERGAEPDPLFHAVLRLDRILNHWRDHWQTLAAQGYGVNQDASSQSLSEVRRFLAVWCARMRPVYMAVSLPDTFTYPDPEIRGRLLADAVLPVCREQAIPLSLM